MEGWKEGRKKKKERKKDGRKTSRMRGAESDKQGEYKKISDLPLTRCWIVDKIMNTVTVIIKRT